MEDRVAARGHRAEGVAVVGVLERDEGRAAAARRGCASAAIAIFSRDLDRRRAVVGVEDARAGRPGASVDELARPGARRARG